jgi:hypothetical protein
MGLGIIAFGVGAAIGIGLFGYSHVTRSSENFTALASILSKALANAQFQASATGTVSVEPRELSLAKDQTVSLDRNSHVLLDPTAKVIADGEIRVQAPSVSVPQALATRSSSEVPTITNFTVFKRVSFDKGMVMTGWTFLTSAQKAPTEEYCYYTEDADTPGMNVVLDLGTDQKQELPKTLPKNLDITAAFNRCVWFKADSR